MGKKSLGDQLFGLVERDQGYAFVSDAVGSLTDDRVLAIARGALKHSEKVVVNLRKFLKTHDREYKRCIAGCGLMHEGMNKDHQCSREHGHQTEHSFLCERPFQREVA